MRGEPIRPADDKSRQFSGSLARDLETRGLSRGPSGLSHHGLLARPPILGRSARACIPRRLPSTQTTGHRPSAPLWDSAPLSRRRRPGRATGSRQGRRGARELRTGLRSARSRDTAAAPSESISTSTSPATRRHRHERARRRCAPHRPSTPRTFVDIGRGREPRHRDLRPCAVMAGPLTGHPWIIQPSACTSVGGLHPPWISRMTWISRTSASLRAR